MTSIADVPAGVSTVPDGPQLDTTYQRLAAEFEQTFSDVRGGVELTYVTGEQVTSRLNEVLGPGGWSFAVKQHAFHDDADEVWVLGELSAQIDGKTVVREQFGSQKIKRSRSTNKPLDIGYDLKGAGTDAMKKCASLLGVGLYLSRREGSPAAGHASSSEPAEAAPVPTGEALVCADCGNPLKEVAFSDGTWTVQKLATYSRNKFGRVLDMACYSAANKARKAQAANG